MRRAAALLVVLAVLVPIGAWAVGGLGPRGTHEAPPADSTQTVAGATATPRPTTADTRRTPGDRPPPVEVQGETRPGAQPARVQVPRSGIDVAVETLRTDAAGRLESPRGWQRAGWFASGAAPGDVGPAVVAGHVDSPTGPAAFTGLEQVRPGDEIVVERSDGTSVTFVVDRTAVVPKGRFPTEAVYGPTPDAQLRLVTCDGPYVRSSGGYQDNLVVWATATGRT